MNETFTNASVSDAQLVLQEYEMIVRRDGKDTQEEKEKLSLWKLHQSGGKGDIKARLKKASRKLYRATRKAKRDYENKIAMTDDRGLLYGYIKSQAQNRVGVGPLKEKEGKEVTDSKKMANLLAQHYVSVFKTEILPMQEVRQMYKGGSPLLKTELTEAFVRLQLSWLRETLSTGPDEIYSRLLRRLCQTHSTLYCSTIRCH